MHRAVSIVGIATLLLVAGCLSTPASPGSPTDTPTTDGPVAVPGVDDGELTNASALIEATEQTVRYKGAVVQLNSSFGTEQYDRRLVVTPGGTPLTLSGVRTVGETSRRLELWSNSSVYAVRVDTANGTDYRTHPQGYAIERVFAEIEASLQAGSYAVSNESTDDGRTVLVADTYSPDGDGPYDEVQSFDARAVVDEAGVVHELTVSATTTSGERGTVFELVRLGTERVHQPAWVADLPATAWLHPELAVDVHDGRYLTIETRGDDPLPAQSSIAVTVNETTVRATFDDALSPGETAYAYLSADERSLELAGTTPTAAESRPLSSPIEIRIMAPDGRAIHSAGIGWESASASEGAP